MPDMKHHVEYEKEANDWLRDANNTPSPQNYDAFLFLGMAAVKALLAIAAVIGEVGDS